MDRFSDYFDFIYLNTNLPKRDAKLIAIECWNKGFNKYEALKEARKLYIEEEEECEESPIEEKARLNSLSNGLLEQGITQGIV